MQKKCRFCSLMFKTDDEFYFETICPDCTDSIKTLLKNDRDLQLEMFEKIKGDSDLKYEFLESVIEDEKILIRIAKNMFKVQAKVIGLGGPGSIADFFR